MMSLMQAFAGNHIAMAIDALTWLAAGFAIITKDGLCVFFNSHQGAAFLTIGNRHRHKLP
jgi:hypothetical protein